MSLDPGEDLIGELTRYGLSRYEARVYLALLRLGRARPLDLARTARIPRQRVYDVIESLIAKGLATRRDEHVEPVDPRMAIERLASRRIARALIEAEALRRLAERLPRPSRGLEERREASRIVYGVEESIAEAIALLTRCRTPPVIVVYKVLDRLRELWPLLRSLLEQAPRGTLIIVPESARIPGEYLEEARRTGARIVRDRCAYLDTLIACDTVILGVPSREHTVETLILENPLLAGALRERLLQAVEEDWID